MINSTVHRVTIEHSTTYKKIIQELLYWIRLLIHLVQYLMFDWPAPDTSEEGIRNPAADRCKKLLTWNYTQYGADLMGPSGGIVRREHGASSTSTLCAKVYHKYSLSQSRWGRHNPGCTITPKIPLDLYRSAPHARWIVAWMPQFGPLHKKKGSSGEEPVRGFLYSFPLYGVDKQLPTWQRERFGLARGTDGRKWEGAFILSLWNSLSQTPVWPVYMPSSSYVMACWLCPLNSSTDTLSSPSTTCQCAFFCAALSDWNAFPKPIHQATCPD